MASLLSSIFATFGREAVIATAVSASVQLGAALISERGERKSARELRRSQEEQQELDDARASYEAGKAKAQVNKERRATLALLASNLSTRGIGRGSSAYFSTTAAGSNADAVISDIESQQKFNVQQGDINRAVFASDERATRRGARATTVGTAIKGIGSLSVEIHKEIE